MPSNHLILFRPLLLPPSIFPSIRVFSNESALCIRWPKYWSFSFSISPSNEYSGLISFGIDWFDLLAVQGTLERLKAYATGSGKARVGMRVCLSWAHHHRAHGLPHLSRRGSVRTQDGSRWMYQRRRPAGMAYLLHLEDEGLRAREGAVLPKAGE